MWRYYGLCKNGINAKRRDDLETNTTVYSVFCLK